MNKKMFLIVPFVLLTLGCQQTPSNKPIPIIGDKYFTVTWTDYNGTVLEVDRDVEKGTMPEYNGELPTREPSAQYTYAFKDWSPALTPVDRDITYMATYTGTIRTYTVRWTNYDGELLKEETNVPYGTEPYYGLDTPQKEPTVDKAYTFDTWQPEISKITSDTTFVATYIEATRQYLITWKNWNDKTLKISSVPYGQVPVYNGINPTKPADENYTYQFCGWDRELVAVTEATTYTAQFTAIPIE